MNIGFIGCGGIARHHMGYLAKFPEVQLTAFCDIDESRARAAAADHRGRAYTDHRALLDREQLDAIYLCIPPFAHTDQAILAAQKGIALFLEKPVALNLEKAQEIREAIEKAAVVSSVGYVWRYPDTTQRAVSLFQQRPIGLVMVYWMGSIAGAPWWKQKDKSGGQLVEQVTHLVDLARYLAGDIRTVCAAFGDRLLKGKVPGLDIPDVQAGLLSFENGVIGAFANTCILSQSHTIGVHVYAQDLVAEVGFGNLRILDKGEVREYQGANDPYLAEHQAFLNAVRSGDRSGILSSYADAVKTLAVTLSANQSAATGKPVVISC